MSDAATDDRLVRIENKLDKLSEAVVAIARTEEQITSLFANTRELNAKLDAHEKDIQTLRERSHLLSNTSVELGAKIAICSQTKDVVDDMRITVHDNEKALARLERLSWIALGGVVSILVYLAEQVLERVM